MKNFSSETQFASSWLRGELTNIHDFYVPINHVQHIWYLRVLFMTLIHLQINCNLADKHRKIGFIIPLKPQKEVWLLPKQT